MDGGSKVEAALGQTDFCKTFYLTSFYSRPDRRRVISERSRCTVRRSVFTNNAEHEMALSKY